MAVVFGKKAPRPCQLSGAFDVRSFSTTSPAETFTLFKTLPTLCSTPVATSAMPARRVTFRAAFAAMTQRLLRLPPLRHVAHDR